MEQETKDMNTVSEGAVVQRSRMLGFVHPEVTKLLLAIVGFLFLNAIIYIVAALGAALRFNLVEIFIYLFVAILYAVPAYGLLKLNRWARMFQLVSSLFMVITGIILIFNGNKIQGPINVITNGLIAIYLLTDTCQHIFKRKSAVTVEEVSI